jgi:DNA-binding NarL/FixJ family response regulator
MVLEAQDDISIVGEAKDGAGAIAMANSLRPDVMLMDVRMPGIDGIDATESIVQADLDTKVLILTTFDMDEYVYAGLRAGASGFLLKDVLPAELISALRAVAAGDAVIAPSATRRLLVACTPMLPTPQRGQQREQILQALTEREREVFPMVAAALTNREISLRLHVSKSTVKMHVSRILAKLQIVVLAYESGLVVPTS